MLIQSDRKRLKLIFLKSWLIGGLLIIGLPACAPLVLSALSVTAIDLSIDRRTAGTYIDDNRMEVVLRGAISAEESLGGSNVSITIFNGIVLLTGQVSTDKKRQYVSELVEKYIPMEQIKAFVNELQLSGRTNLSGRFNDSWLTGKAKLRLLRAKNISAKAVKIVTEHGKVYLLGKVTREEAEIAVNAIRDLNGVTHIVKVFEYIE